MVSRDININIRRSGAAGAVGQATGAKPGGIMGAISGAIRSPLGALDKVGAGMGAVVGILGKVLGPILFIAAGVGILVKASGYLSRTIERIFGQLLRIVKPIGDVVATLLQPLIILLTPFAKAMNLLFKPFLAEANKLMKLGGKLLNTPGFEGEGLDLLLAGASILLKPFVNVFIIAIGEALKGVVETLFVPLEFLANVFDVLTGGVFDLSGKLKELKDGAIVAIDTAITDFIKNSDDLVLQFADSKITYGQALLDVIGMHKEAGDDTKALAQSIIDEVKGMPPELQKFLHDNPDSVYNVWVTSAKDVASATKAVFDDLKSYINSNKPTPGVGGGGSSGGGGAQGSFANNSSGPASNLFNSLWEQFLNNWITQQGYYYG